jgi:hypothetical protein
MQNSPRFCIPPKSLGDFLLIFAKSEGKRLRICRAAPRRAHLKVRPYEKNLTCSTGAPGGSRGGKQLDAENNSQKFPDEKFLEES